jgi:hypothetical protein
MMTSRVYKTPRGYVHIYTIVNSASSAYVNQVITGKWGIPRTLADHLESILTICVYS